MRKIDKSLNIAKANLLSEQRYLTSKGIIRESVENDGADGDETDMINYIKSLGGLKEEPLNELSPELKQRAFDSASDEASKLKNSGDKDNYNPLKGDRRLQQANTIGNTVDPKFIKVANDIGTYLGLQATVKKVSDPRGDKISLSFHKGGEVGTYDKILLYTITKNGYDDYVKNVQLPENFARRIERLIMALQQNELAGEQTAR